MQPVLKFFWTYTKNAIQRARYAWIRRRPGLRVLCYHSVLPKLTGDLYRERNAVAQHVFREQMRAIRRSACAITIDELISAAEGQTQLPHNSVLVTFDDGYQNNYEYAAPILDELHIPAVFFVATGYVGSSRILWSQLLDEYILQQKQAIVIGADGQPHVIPSDERARIQCARKLRQSAKTVAGDRLLAFIQYLEQVAKDSIEVAMMERESLYRFMTWAEVQDLARHNFEIGSHTVNHLILSRLAVPLIEDELSNSKNVIETTISRPCRLIAFPNGGHGDFNIEVMDTCARCNYFMAFTTIPGVNRLPFKRFRMKRYTGCIY